MAYENYGTGHGAPDSAEQLLRKLEALAGYQPSSSEHEPLRGYGNPSLHHDSAEPSEYGTSWPARRPVASRQDVDGSVPPGTDGTPKPATTRAMQQRAYQAGYRRHMAEQAARRARRRTTGLVLSAVLVVAPGVAAGSRTVVEGEASVPALTRFVDGGVAGYVEPFETAGWLLDKLRGKPHPTLTEIEQQRNADRLHKNSSVKK
ncbi:hypothetical protein IPP75_01820 [Candidatus Saccharibacteria bacterium]|nr:MAG: hypothetical protein IPP75_01820 [Candidatus Saccharibacteria bacterium]